MSQQQSQAQQLKQETVFDKISDYISAELNASIKDYQFLNKLNRTTLEPFNDYISVAEKIAKNVDRINANQTLSKSDLIKRIDEIDQKVNQLEALAYKIDSYSKRLEDTFKQLSDL